MIIRNATKDDIPTMIAMGAAMHDETNYKDRNYSPEKLLHDGRYMVDHPDKFFLCVAEDDQGVIGMYVGFITEFYFGYDTVAYDLLLYTRQNRRGSLAAARMIEAFTEWAFANGASEIRPGVSTGFQPERTAQLYERMGFESIGYIFRKVK
jgi:GNAT superfamily N-acetyltransferase